jgi:hypothetical protein
MLFANFHDILCLAKINNILKEKTKRDVRSARLFRLQMDYFLLFLANKRTTVELTSNMAKKQQNV